MEPKSPQQLKQARLKRTLVSLLAGIAVGAGCHQLPPEYQVYCGLMGKFLIFIIGAQS
jgi:hypothetical protein